MSDPGNFRQHGHQSDVGEDLWVTAESRTRRKDGPARDTTELPPDFNLEEVVLAMILRGETPPPLWRPWIKKLHFWKILMDLSPLAGLTALKWLHLRGTQVSDVSPLAGLTALIDLDLRGTQVSDVSPLAGLTGLVRLDLAGTQVSDVTVLDHMLGLSICSADGYWGVPSERGIWPTYSPA